MLSAPLWATSDATFIGVLHRDHRSFYVQVLHALSANNLHDDFCEFAPEILDFMTLRAFRNAKAIILARHKRCDVYCGARETVGGSSVSSGCWGEDSNHENEWALRPPRCSAHSLFFERLHFQISPSNYSSWFDSRIHFGVDT